MKTKVVLAAAMLAAVQGAEAAGWKLTIGPAWRSRVKTEIAGSAQTPALGISSTTDTQNGPIEEVQDPDYPHDPSYTKWADTKITTATQVTQNDTAARLDADDTESPLGLKADLGYELWSDERWSVGLNLKFAGYWNLRSEAYGVGGGGTVQTTVTKDYYLYSSGPIPPMSPTPGSGFNPDPNPYLPYRETLSDATETIRGTRTGIRLRSDLWQIGFGPVGSFRICDRLEAYGGVEALCNLAVLDYSGPAGCGSEVKCMPGFGGRIGLSGALTDWCGIFAECGYEWIDAAEGGVGGVRTRTDYSSLVLSAGMLFSW